MESIIEEARRLRKEVKDLEKRLQDGKDYLMTEQADAIIAQDALEAFGFRRDGL